jgi:hypothetical protein
MRIAPITNIYQTKPNPRRSLIRDTIQKLKDHTNPPETADFRKALEYWTASGVIKSTPYNRNFV